MISEFPSVAEVFLNSAKGSMLWLQQVSFFYLNSFVKPFKITYAQHRRPFQFKERLAYHRMRQPV